MTVHEKIRWQTLGTRPGRGIAELGTLRLL
jgi:hypothetical protein